MRIVGGCVVAVLALGLAGCGGSAPAAEGSATKTATRTAQPAAPATPVQFDQSEIMHHLQMTDPFMYVDPSGQKCRVAVVLTSAAEVSMYADAGDNVATNPARTAGLKVSDPEGASCNRLITQALADLA